MSPLLALAGAVLGAAATLVVLAVAARVRYARRLPSFRCRVGPVESRRGRRRRPLGRAGAPARRGPGTCCSSAPAVLRLWLTPLPAGVDQDTTVRRLGPDEVRGLGLHPVALRLVTPSGRPVEVATARSDADVLVGPYLAAAMSDLPSAPRERGAW